MMNRSISYQLKLAIVSLIMFLITFLISAQSQNTIVADSLFDMHKEKVHLDMALSFKTQNYFRGLLPSPAPTIATHAGMISKNWIIGMYGGVGFDGHYQETDFILIYRKPRIDFHLEYYYNYTKGITDIKEPSGLFDFNKQTTRGLLDFVIHVRLDKNNHWNFTSSTFLFGRDTNLEEIIGGIDPVTVRTDQRYSQYFELAYNWYIGSNKIKGHLGGSFSWENPSGAQFYGNGPGINNMGISFSRKLRINSEVQLPVKASMYLNPMAETTYLILSLNLIELSKL